LHNDLVLRLEKRSKLRIFAQKPQALFAQFLQKKKQFSLSCGQNPAEANRHQFEK